MVGIGVKELGKRGGTNPLTGTTEIEMAKMLNLGRVVWNRGVARDLSGIADHIERGQVVLLRTLMGGPHWVTVKGYERDSSGQYQFAVECPTSGPQTFNGAELLACWKARDYDHFVVDVFGTRQVYASPEVPPHQQTLKRFLGGAAVVPDEKLVRWHHDAIKDAVKALERFSVDPLYKIPYETPTLVFYRSGPLSGLRPSLIAA